MKVLFNGLPATLPPLSGVGRYVNQLGQALENLLGDAFIFGFRNHNSKKLERGTNDYPLSSSLRAKFYTRNILGMFPGAKSLRYYFRNRQFHSYVEKVKPTLYHETNYALFDFKEGPTVITLYDLSFIRHPGWHPKDRVKYFEQYCLKKLSQVDAVLTISEFSKSEIVQLLGIDPKKIYVTYPGVDRQFKPEGKRMYGFPKEYILFVGNLEPRKNLPTLLNAYRALPKELRERYPLVISGALGWHTHEFTKALQLFKGREKPILTGYISQPHLPDLYRGASLFVYPSFYEGFGLPVLEAMASGVPVIGSQETSIPEVIGEAGVLVNPYNMDDLKEAMIQLLKDEKTKMEMAKKGIIRAKQFSWEKCALETLEVYQKCSIRRNSK